MNLIEILFKVYYKYLLRFNSAKGKKLPTYTIFEHEIKLTTELKKERIYKLLAKELETVKQYIQKILTEVKI